MEKIELSNSSLRAIENYIAGKNILKDSVYRKLLTELNRCLKSLDNYVTFQTAEGTMQQYCDRLLKKYEGLKDAMLKTRDYYDNLTDWKREFHNVGMNKDSEEEFSMKLVRVRKKKDENDDLKIEKEVVDRINKAMKLHNEANELVKSCSALTKKMSFDFHKDKKIMDALKSWNEIFNGGAI